ncbi:hypothetical protein GEMRC1_005785 [Eukaryota sp. GEM-RC1]
MVDDVLQLWSIQKSPKFLKSKSFPSGSNFTVQFVETVGATPMILLHNTTEVLLYNAVDFVRQQRLKRTHIVSVSTPSSKTLEKAQKLEEGRFVIVYVFNGNLKVDLFETSKPTPLYTHVIPTTICTKVFRSFWIASPTPQSDIPSLVPVVLTNFGWVYAVSDFGTESFNTVFERKVGLEEEGTYDEAVRTTMAKELLGEVIQVENITTTRIDKDFIPQIISKNNDRLFSAPFSPFHLQLRCLTLCLKMLHRRKLRRWIQLRILSKNLILFLL